MKHIGIRVCGPPSINEILYFDEIAIIHNGLSTTFGIELTPEDHSRMDLLTQKGILIEPESALRAPEIASVLNDKFAIVVQRLVRAGEIMRAPSTERATAEHLSDPGLVLHEHERLSTKIEVQVADIQAELERLIAMPYRCAFEAHSRYRPTTVFNLATASTSYPTESTVSTVLDVIIKNFPLPRPEVSFDAVLDFRADEDAMRALRRLRKWAAKCASTPVSAKEIEEEIQDLVDQYTEHMKLHKMKYECGVLRTFVSATLELAESLMKLNFRAALDTLITLKTNSLALTEEEMKAPGREVAYLILAREKLAN